MRKLYPRYLLILGLIIGFSIISIPSMRSSEVWFTNAVTQPSLMQASVVALFVWALFFSLCVVAIILLFDRSETK